MSKYDNYIFLAICETTVDLYKPTNFSTYPEYCKGMARTLKLGNANGREKYHILLIIEMLDKVFSLSNEVTGKYIADYFNLSPEKHAEFQQVVLDTKRLFPDIPNPKGH